MMWRRRPLFGLVTPTRSSIDFFARVIDEFATRASADGFSFILETPKGSYEVRPWLDAIERLARTLGRRDVLVIIPALSEEAEYAPLQKLLNSSRGPIVITFDLPLRVGKRDVPHVRGSDELGGRKAGEAAGWFLDDMNLTRPARVLAVQGLWGDGRISGFKSVLGVHVNPPTVTVVQERLKWSRQNAKEVVLRYLRQPDGGDFDLIFCANDEMALGARAAVWEWQRNKVGAARLRSRVIGFDGIDTVRYLLREKDHILLNSVDVGVKNQVVEAMKLIKALYNREEPQATEVDIEPTGLVLGRQEQRELLHWGTSRDHQRP